MAENKKELVVSLKAKLGGFVNTFRKGIGSVKEFGRTVKEMNKRLGETESRSKRIVKLHDEYIQALNRSQEVISKRGLYRYRVMESIAVAGLLAGPVRKTIQDQTERAKLGTALKLADNENLREATKPIHDLARSIPLTADGLMKIGQAGAKIGVSRKNIVKFTEEVGKSLVAWRDTVDSGTVERIARLVKLQKISTSQLPGIFDMFTYLGGKAGTSPGEILKAIDGASEGWANFKLSLPQMSALSTTLVSLAGSSEEAGSALSNMFQALSKAQVIGDSTNKILYSLGLTAEALRGKAEKNPQQALNLLFDRLKGLEGGARTKAITGLFGKGSAKPIGLLIEHLDEYKEMQKDFGTDVYEGKREKEYNKVVGELGSKFQLLGNSLKDLMQSVTITVFPILAPVVDKFKEWTDAITEFVDKHPKLVGAITSIIGSILALRVLKFGGGYIFHLLTGWIPGVKKMWKGFKVWAKSSKVLGAISTGGALLGKKVMRGSIGKMLFRALGFAVKGFFWPWLLVDAALMILENWKPIKEFFLDIWKDVEPYWDAFCNKLKGWGEDILAVWTKIKIFFSALGSVIKEPLSSLADKTANFFEGLGAIVNGSPLVSGILDWWNGKTSSSNTVSNVQGIKPRGSDVSKYLNINSPITVNVNGADNPTIVANEVTERIKGYYETLLYDDAVRTI